MSGGEITNEMWAKRLITFDASMFLVWCVSWCFGLNPMVVIVESESMMPALQIGDIVVGYNTTVRHNDIVVFNTTKIVHRVVWSHANRYITKGDANPVDDRVLVGVLQRHQIDAVVHRVGIPWLGRAIIRFKRLEPIYWTLYAAQITKICLSIYS